MVYFPRFWHFSAFCTFRVNGLFLQEVVHFGPLYPLMHNQAKVMFMINFFPKNVRSKTLLFQKQSPGDVMSVFFQSVPKCIFKNSKKHIFTNILLKFQNLVLKFLEEFLITPKNNIQKFEELFWKGYFKKPLCAVSTLKKFFECILYNQ